MAKAVANHPGSVRVNSMWACPAMPAEVCGLHVEDLDLRVDDEHARISGKGGAVRPVLLDDRGRRPAQAVPVPGWLDPRAAVPRGVPCRLTSPYLSTCSR